MIRLSLLTFMVLIFFSCRKQEVEAEITNDVDFAAELRSEADTLTIENNTYVLIPHLWRDFMSISEENGSVLKGLGNLTENNRLSIPDNVTLKKLYIVNGDEIWTANYTEINTFVNYQIQGSVDDGPKWGPDIAVDVICEFESAGIIYRVLAQSIDIDKIE